MRRPVVVGERFGRLVVTGPKVLRWMEGEQHTRGIVPVRCDCGVEKEVRWGNLSRGHIESCGCLRRELSSARMRRHGMDGTRPYGIWHGMWARCTNQRLRGFRDYGGRGITVDARWEKFEPFYEWALANGYADDLVIDRIDNDGPYSPENCRWVTVQTNNRNTRGNRRFMAFGETKSVVEWTEDARCNVPYQTLHARIARWGWDGEEALTVPAKPRGGGWRKYEKRMAAV